jgi:putative phosphoesterase
MTSILLFSDTHSFLDEKLMKHFDEVDEIWHAGDIGFSSFFEPLEKQFPNKIIKAVHGNIDDSKTRIVYPENQIFYCENVKVFITHIGGYPDHYARGIKEKLIAEKPLLFICGHSHILKVIFDKKLNVLHMNPGAAGNHGFHQTKTCLKFNIDKDKITDLKIIEFGKRGM